VVCLQNKLTNVELMVFFPSVSADLLGSVAGRSAHVLWKRNIENGPRG
jgi:hypothetical protein